MASPAEATRAISARPRVRSASTRVWPEQVASRIPAAPAIASATTP
jgi:hypothetical protein